MLSYHTKQLNTESPTAYEKNSIIQRLPQRADAEKPFMGLTTFSGELPALKDIGVAKNYLKEDELKILNNLVSGYFVVPHIK